MLTLADSTVLLSIYKPIVFGLMIGLWGWTASTLDKDLSYFYLKRQMWNFIFLAVGLVSILLWLMIPYFWVGFALSFLFILGSLVGYHFYRNTEVPKGAQWSFDINSFRQQWDESQRQKAQKAATVRIIDSEGEMVPVPVGEDPLTPVYEALENILEFALPRRAERIDMLAGSQETVVAVQIDGVKYPQTKLDGKIGLTLIDYLKQAAGLDVKDRRKKQAGKLKIDHDIPHTVEITTSGSTRGLNLSMLIDPTALRSVPFKKLGLLDSQMEQLKPIFEELDRAVIIVSPPHHGMTSTIYSFTGTHDPYRTNIMTLEDEIAFELEGVGHGVAKVGTDAPALSKQLESMILREPKVVMLSHLTDPEVAKVIAKFHDEARFYLGLRQKDSFTALKAWCQAVGDKAAAGAALRAIVCQRLLRKLCPTCRIAYKPDPALLKKLNLPADRVKQLYKHSGQVVVKEETVPCPDCHGLGYRGRRAVFEVMLLDDEARALIGEGQTDQLKNHLRRGGMLYMQEAALALAAEGITSITEIRRVLAGE